MFKLCVVLIGLSIVSIGCNNTNVAATPAPVASETETPITTPSTSLVKAPTPEASDGKWVTVKGKIIWDKSKGAAPERMAIKAEKDEEVCAKDKEFTTEDWVINPKTGAIKNVVVWVVPEPTDPADIAALKKAQDDKKSYSFKSFKAGDIHPSLAKLAKKQIEIDQPCCRFIPHVVVAQEGQEILIKNSAIVPHNAKWTLRENGEINPLIPAGGEYKLEKALVAERFPIKIECSIHRWMNAWVRVFDHPYFALTDDDGNFEIKNAPVMTGKLRLFIWQENGMHGGTPGRFGETIEVKPGTLDLKEIIFVTGK